MPYRRISLGTKVIGPRLHHRIPVFGRPFLQRNEARHQRDQAQQERDETRLERDNARKELEFLRAQIEQDGLRRELGKTGRETIHAGKQGDDCERERDVRIQLSPAYWIERIEPSKDRRRVSRLRDYRVPNLSDAVGCARPASCNGCAQRSSRTTNAHSSRL